MDLFWQITIVEFLLNVAVFSAAAIGFGPIRALTERILPGCRLLESAATGLLFGTATAIALLMPIHMNGGGAISGQTVLLVLAAPIAGYAAALSAGVVALASAGWLWTSDSTLGAAACISAGWSLLVGAATHWLLMSCWPDKKGVSYWMLPLLGLLSTVPMIGDLLLRAGQNALQNSIVSLFGTGVLAALILGMLFLHEKRRHQAEKELRESEARLALQAKDLAVARDSAEAASRAKSEFLANMSHELRTPLNAIIGFSSLMRDGLHGPLLDKYAEYSGMVCDSGAHLLSVINDILDIAKAESNKIELCEDDVDIAEVVGLSSTIVRAMAEKAGVRYHVTVAEALPHLRADQVKLRQILINLLSNAVKFTPSGGDVSLSVEAGPNDWLQFRITDTGIGIPEDKIELAMQPFGQIDSRLARRYEGTGLGLPLTKRLVEIHGGTFDLCSKLGQGTIVTVCLPGSLGPRMLKQAN